MNDIWPDGGRVSWLYNDGTPDRAAWPRRYIGKSPAMHRLKSMHTLLMSICFSTKPFP